MTEDQIIADWFQRDSNTSKLLTIAYSDEVYNFIISTCSKWGKDIYKVNGDWQIVTNRSKISLDPYLSKWKKSQL